MEKILPKRFALLVLLFFSTAGILLAQPSVTTVFMTGAMKDGHSLTINYTFVPGPNPEGVTTFQWFRYDDNNGTNPVPIAGATGTTYVLTAADVGRHIGCVITPVDNVGTSGAPFTFQPWNGLPSSPLTNQGPNPVLANAASCFKADGIGVPIPGNLILNPSFLCSPRTLDWQIDYTGINYSNTLSLFPRVTIDWGDGNIETVVPALLNPQETNMAKQTWRVTQSHIFDYSAGSLASTVPGSRCTYTMGTSWAVGTYSGVGYGTVTRCDGFGIQTQPFTVWDTEDSPQPLGQIDIEHDPTSTGVQTIPPAPLPPSNENVNVCEDDTNPVRLIDNTDFNCTPALENPQPNDQARWVQWVYGTAGSNINAPGGVGGSIIINGVSYTAAQLPVYGRPQYIPASTLGPSGVITDNIVMPTTATPNQQLFVTMRSWNICNAFDRNTADGCGLNPQQGGVGTDIFNIYGITNQTMPANCGPLVGAPPNPYYAHNDPVTRLFTITIIDSPDPPTVPNRDVCQSESRQISVTPVIVGLTYEWYTNLADAAARNSPIANGANFTPTTAQAPAGTVSTFHVVAVAANNCYSTPTTVTLTRRPSLAQPPPFSTAPIDICPNSTYTYALPIDPATETPGGVTEYVWTIPVTWTLNSGQGTRQISVTSDGTIGASAISVVRRYITPTSNGTQCTSPPRNVTVNIRANPTANITPGVVNICEGETPTLDGNPTNTFGTISSHLWTGNTAILDDPNIQSPSILPTATAGTYNLTYTVTNSIGCSGSDAVVVNISPNPGIATVGLNQALCGTLTSNPMGGSNPAPGTGTWSFVSSAPARPAPAISGINDPNATITITAGNEGAYTMRWTVVSGTCTSFADIVVDLGSTPTASVAGPNFSACGETANLAGNTPVIGSGTWTVVSGPGACVGAGCPISIVAPNSPTSQLDLNGPGFTYGAYTLRWTIASGTCLPSFSDVIVTFNRPATAAVDSDFTSCVDQTVLAPIAISGTVADGSGVATQQGRWQVVTGGGTFVSNGANPGGAITGPTINDSYTPTAADFAAGFVELRLVAIDPDGAGPCGDVNSLTNLTINFDRKPTDAVAGPPQSLCVDNTTLAATPVNNGGQGTWSTVTAGVTFGDVNSPTSSVSNLPLGPTTLTWTVESAETLLGTPGACANTTSDVIITVNPLPNVFDPAPQLCELVESSSIRPGVDLTSFNDGVTGIAGSVDRTVQWFDNLPRIPANLIATPTSFTVGNGQILYTTVTTTSTTCTADGVVTFTVNPLPAASDIFPEICEDLPVGSNNVDNVDLTFYDDQVYGAATPNRVVTWFTDATYTTPVPDATDVDGVSDTDQFFARVRNTVTNCENDATLTFIVNPRPVVNPIAGPTSVCADAAAVVLYQVTTVNPGSTYVWNIPQAAGEFVQFAGGGINDFFVLLNFPNVVPSPGLDISVTEFSIDGCPGVTETLNIAVESSPPAISIVGPLAVCANETGVVYSVANLPNTTFAWSVPVGSSIIGGQGTNTITVNFGALSGNVSVLPTTTTGCPGNPDSDFVTVNTRPILDPLLNATNCSNDLSGIIFDVAAGSVPAPTYNITAVNVDAGLFPITGPTSGLGLAADAIANDEFENLTGGPLNVRYTVIPVSAEGCEGAPRTVTLTVRPEPTLDPNLGVTLCSQQATGIILKVATGSFPADQFEIVSITPNGLTASAGNPTVGIFGPTEIADDAWINMTTAPVTVTYRIRPINSSTGCIGDPPQPLNIIINPEPIVAPDAETICSGFSPTITLTSSLAGSTFAWSVKSVTGIVIGAASGTGNMITDVLVNNSGAIGTVTYEVRATGSIANGACISAPADVTITVEPAPPVNNITQTVCSDAAGGTTSITDLVSLEPAVNSGGGVTFAWFQDAALTIPINAPQVNAYPLANGIPVFVRVSNGICNNVASVNYTVNPLPSASASAPQFNGFEITCNGANNGRITAVASQGSPPYLFSIDGGVNFFPTAVFNSLAPNTYTITVRDSRGCVVNSNPVTIAEPTVLTVTPDVIIDPACRGTATGSIQALATGGIIGTYSYSINGGPFQASDLFGNLSSGFYTITVRDANNCTASANATVSDPLQLTGSVTGQINVDCNGNNSGSVTVEGAGGVAPYTYAIDGVNFQASGTFATLPAGGYTVTVRDANNCITPVPVNITQPGALVLNLSSKTDVICNGESSGAITVIAAGGTAPYEYAIDGATFLASGDFTGLPFGPQTLTVRDANLCVATLLVVINQPNPINGSITSQTNVDCFGNSTGSVTVNGSGGTGSYLFALDGGGFGGSGTFTGLTAGAYVVTIQDQNNCTTDVPVTITEPTVLGGSVVNSTNVLCAGGNSGTVEVLGSGGTSPYQYSINGGGLFTSNPSFTGLTAGPYTVIVRDNNLCTFNIDFTITQPTPLVAGIASQTPVDCRNNATGSVTVSTTGGTVPYEFSIDGSTFQATGTFAALAAGNYIVRVRDANACTQNVNVTITEPPQLVLALQNQTNVDCNGNSTGSITVAASGGVGSYTYSSDGVIFGATQTFNGFAAGTHTLFTRDANNCQAQLDVVITEPLVLTLNVVSTTDVLCNGQNTGSITVEASGGAGSYEYSRDGFIFTPLNVFFGLLANNYNITVRDANGCTTSQLVTINEPAALTASTTQTADILCYLGADAELTVATSGGVGVLRFLLLEDPANSTGLFSGVFSGIRAGTYSIRVTDDNGCSVVTVPVTVAEPSQLTITAQVTSDYNGFPLSCEGASDARIEATAAGGTGAYTYTLLNPGIVASNATGIFDLLPAGNYTVQVQDVNNCLTLSLPVLIFDPFPFSPGFIGFNQAICQGDNPALIEELVPPFGGIGNYQYQWQESIDGVAFTDIAGAMSAVFTPPVALAQTTYYKRMVTTGTCAALESNTVQVTVNPLPTVTFTAPAEVCEGDFFLLEFNFTGAPPFRFDYDDGINVYNNNVGNFYTPVPIFNFANTTTYTLTRVVDINGCVIFPNQSVTVNVSKIDPTFTIVSPTAQCSGSTFSFEWNVAPDVEYTWVFGDGAQQIIAPNTLPVGVNTIDHIYTSLVPTTSINFPVILRATNLSNGCGPKQSNQAITVFPSIVVNVLPSDNSICSGETVNFNNLTQGANTHRWFYRELGNVGQELDVRTTASVNYTFTNTTTQNPITYEVVYVGSNTNGCSDGITIPIEVYRGITASFDEGIVPPFVGGMSTVTVTNTSVPIDVGAFNYDWNFGVDATPAAQNGAGPFAVTYSSPGNKTIILEATNIAAQAAGENCVSTQSKIINIVLPPLTAGFRAIPLKACFPTTIEVVENTSTGDIFQWQVFDDGGRLVATSNAPLPEFRIVNPGIYDIFLQTTNSITGQNAFAQQNGIEVYDQPQAAFEARPTTFFVPDTELTTFNFTNGASQYDWDFGDGGTSMDFEPKHIYTLEGKYEIVLVAGFDHGNHDIDGDGILDGNIVCYDTARREVVGREGGLTKIPNAFTPNPNGPNGGIPGNGTFNDVFLPITRGVEEFEMQIYDRWGNLIFESRDKNQGWDGYDKNSRLLPSGVYVYKLVLRLSDGQRTTQIGDVTLIR